jgi:hypothetical protein
MKRRIERLESELHASREARYEIAYVPGDHHGSLAPAFDTVEEAEAWGKTLPAGTVPVIVTLSGEPCEIVAPAGKRSR